MAKQQIEIHTSNLQAIEDAKGTGRKVLPGFGLMSQEAPSVSKPGQVYDIWSGDEAKGEEGIRFYGPWKKPKKQPQEQEQKQPQQLPCPGFASASACAGGLYPGVPLPDDPGVRPAMPKLPELPELPELPDLPLVPAG